MKIMVEVLDVLGTTTKEMKHSRFKMSLKKVAGITKLDDGLKKLDKMTNEGSDGGGGAEADPQHRRESSKRQGPSEGR